MTDSTQATLEHKHEVAKVMIHMAQRLMDRAMTHDDSKLFPPEKEGFDAANVKLSTCVYMSEEYKKSLAELESTLAHHYRVNSHHPQHFENGIDDMSLLDLVEMYCDWKAGSERNLGGNIFDSINKNKDRFKMTPQLASIFKNTAERE